MKNNILSLCLLAIIYSCQSQQTDSVFVSADSTLNPLGVQILSTKEAERYRVAVDEVLNKNLLRGSFNGAVLVAKNGQIVYEKYVGSQDTRKKTGDSISASTPFQIASTGKTMTGAAVLKLWEEGRLDLSDDVSKYFPGFPYPDVTIKSLLNHRSGLPNYLYYMEKEKWPRQQQASNEEILNTLMKWKPAKAANADKRFQYCNTNYVLLALIVEKVSGISFPEYMKTTFFEPLGMNNSFVIGANEQAVHMQSYQHSNALWSLDFADGSYGDKNIYSTPRDLLIWDRAITTGKVLTDQTLEAAYTPYSNEKPGVHNYGLGWRLLLYPNSKRVIYHNGHWHGFNSAFARLPDEEATIIILTNRHNNGVYTAAKKLYDVFGNYEGKAYESEE